jgi:hypothetical protein
MMGYFSSQEKRGARVNPMMYMHGWNDGISQIHMDLQREWQKWTDDNLFHEITDAVERRVDRQGKRQNSMA